MPNVVVITPPAANLVSLAEAKSHLRVEHSDDDTRIQALLWAAQTEFAGPDGWTGRSFSVQQLELRLPQFFGCAEWDHFRDYYHGNDITLPCPPLLRDDTHLLTVKYTDAGGAEQTVDSSLYSVLARGGGGVARIALNYAQAWPAPRWQADAVRIRYFAGYAGDDPRAETIKAAIKLHVGMLYDGEDEAKARAAIQNLLSPFRVF